MSRSVERAGGQTAFISATTGDLEDHRAAARDAAIDAEFFPSMMEYFPVSGERPPLAACLAKVDQADLVVVIVAHRYGWEPPEQPGGQRRSITWLECERAAATGKEVLAFLVDDGAAWPDDKKEEFPLLKALRDGSSTPEMLDAVQGKIRLLRDFTAWLGARGVQATFATPVDLRGKVVNALHHWRRGPSGAEPRAVRPRSDDPGRYLKALYLRTAHIDIRGLQAGPARAHRFPIEDL